MKIRFSSATTLLCFLAVGLAGPRCCDASDSWVTYRGHDGPGRGRQIVLVSGDEEYRSEEALPQLGKILARRHGFDCTVLFAIDPATGLVHPNKRQSIPGLDALRQADLMILFVRRRDLPDDQMQLVDEYLRAGKPVIGLRTSTHAFQPSLESRWAHYNDSYHGDQKEWDGGFGRLVLGETWIAHHGKHKHESTRGLIAPGASEHPILRGIKDGDIWGPTDVYTVRLPLPGDSQPLVMGQVIQRRGPYDENDANYGMRPDDDPPVPGAKNDPLMPIAWTKTYQLPGGKPGRAFTSTIGASTDLANEATRRLIVNAVYWGLGMEDRIPSGGAKVDVVGEFEPTKYESRNDDYWDKRKMSVDEHRLKDEAK
jgi:hypothetical protein